MTLIAVVDTETTGVSDEDKLIELAVVRFWYNTDSQIFNPYTKLFNPGIDIPPQASAIHHITNNDVCSCDLFDVFAWEEEVRGVEVLAAHNADFDRKFLPPDARPWICTYKCSVVQWPDAPAHSNQVLRYWLGLRPNLDGAGYPHRALYDALVTTELLRKLLETHTVEDLIAVSEQPVLLPRVYFGKHKGAKWNEVPRDYLQWVSRQDMDTNVLYTVRHWLNA